MPLKDVSPSMQNAKTKITTQKSFFLAKILYLKGVRIPKVKRFSTFEPVNLLTLKTQIFRETRIMRGESREYSLKSKSP
jgi:hypothetical protein